MKEVQITAADDGIRLDRWFKRHLPQVPHGLLEKSLRKGFVRVNGKKVSASDRMVEWNVVTFPEEWEKGAVALRVKTRYIPTEDEVKALQRAVLYKDAEVLVINKPSGLAVQGGSKQTKCLDDMLDALTFDSSERPRLVHRLDKDTSGVLVLARTRKAATMLTRQFASKETEKFYVALVKGLPLPMKGVIDLALSKQAAGKDSRTSVQDEKPSRKHEKDDDYEAVDVDEDDGKPAISEYQVLEHLSNSISWVELKPITGRTHQLRVHMAAIGHPIIGDGKYGGAEAFIQGSMGFSRTLHLHALRIRLRAGAGKLIDVKAPQPTHMQQSREMLGME